MKSTLLNMTAVLFGITLVASAGVGFVNMITVEPIAAAKEAATLAALNEVLPNGFVVLDPAETKAICREAVEKHQNGEPGIREKLDAGACMADLTMANKMVAQAMGK